MLPGEDPEGGDLHFAQKTKRHNQHRDEITTFLAPSFFFKINPQETVNPGNRQPGAPGVDSCQGVDGCPGVDGFPGVDGCLGVDGFPGVDGFRGVDGFPGVLPGRKPSTWETVNLGPQGLTVSEGLTVSWGADDFPGADVPRGLTVSRRLTVSPPPHSGALSGAFWSPFCRELSLLCCHQRKPSTRETVNLGPWGLRVARGLTVSQGFSVARGLTVSKGSRLPTG